MENNIITSLIELLGTATFYDCGDTIDIAKGKYQLPLSIKEARNSMKRNKKV